MKTPESEFELLQSNLQPCKTKSKNFIDKFQENFSLSHRVDIAVGYVTTESLAELKRLSELNPDHHINLTIGMHYFDLFTKSEYRAACDLNNFLMSHDRGEVRLVTPFPYHGKLYAFSNELSPVAGIVGSNNLSGIVENGTRVYETSLFFRNQTIAEELLDFIEQLTIPKDNISQLQIDKFRKSHSPLEGQENARRVGENTLEECKASLTNTTFEIELKPAEVSAKSNLNVYFGEGRKGKNGLVKPRHWYEVEIIVPKEITCQPGYPDSKEESGSFDVITDDGWTFKCYVGGDYKKNFRSENDLRILGRWIKGRLEEEGVLDVGSPVTRETLSKYGRNTFTLTKTRMPNCWYIDFGVKR